ncbi:hypothetical protein GIY21_02120 [Xanthomonas sontii]|uniref:Uncharacterized protein n=1 Tax=Xanthomonas sontii TaxID=2650745 RepID=A0A6N7Q439_9XANT|nr:hypothetical protein [Xanthomonas sontii]MRG99088.1 hypothetical protein [Xanthomonas sontii]MRH73121.1 hypothetical protein [Xanthomonas sontii]
MKSFFNSNSFNSNGNGFRALRELLFFACAKKSNQKKHTPGRAAPRCARGPRTRREFSEGTSMCLPKTTRILRVAPHGVLPAVSASPYGGLRATAKAEQQQQQQQ